MKKLNEQYWEGKFDELLPCDMKSIADAFEGVVFKPAEKVLLAVLLLQGMTTVTVDEFNKLVEVVYKFNTLYAYEPMFAVDFHGGICCIRYNYRKFLNCIPSAIAQEAVTAIYNRLGLALEDEDVHRIGASISIYSMFLEQVKKECGNSRYFYFPEHLTEQCPQDGVNLMWLNTYVLFGKLGFSNLNMFKILSTMGTVCVPYTAYSFEDIGLELGEALSKVYEESHDKMYVTEQESSVVASI